MINLTAEPFNPNARLTYHAWSKDIYIINNDYVINMGLHSSLLKTWALGFISLNSEKIIIGDIVLCIP